MSEILWYFAQGDVEQGPVSASKLSSMAHNGQLRPSDLVWKEGMDDWAPAREIHGLFSSRDESATVPQTPVIKADSQPEGAINRPQTGRGFRRTDGASQAAATTKAPVKQRAPSPTTSRSAGVKSPLPPQPTTAAPSGETASVQTPRRETVRPSGKRRRMAGAPSVLVGLVLVIGARGCDMMAARYADRVAAMSQVVEIKFQEEWDNQRNTIQQRISALRAKAGLTSRESSELQMLNDNLAQLNRQKQDELNRLRSGKWRELRSTANTIRADNVMWAFWRGGVFLVGTLLLSFGLAARSFTSDGPERWICLIMLGIILFSLYMDGAAWSSQANLGK